MKSPDAVSALKALAHEHRLASFRALVQAGTEGMAVGALQELLALPAATLTAHLNQLRATGLIQDVREGRVIRMRADYARMNKLLDYLTENCCAGRPCGPAAKGGVASAPSSVGKRKRKP